MKKIFKSLFLTSLLILLSLVLVACQKEDNNDEVEDNIFTVVFKDSDGTVLSEQEIEKGKPAKAPDVVAKEGFEFTGWDKEFTNVSSDLVVTATYKEVLTELDDRLTSALTPDFDYVGKDFINDGVGIVRLNRVVDGDTISVYSPSSSQAITIRFLGIDTPESTGSIEPWGKAASAFVKEILYSAESVLLEAEGERMDSGGKRYLAWVWYKPVGGTQYRLLNLEEVEFAYSKYSQKVDSKYHEVMKEATNKASQTKKRLWGEIDPNHNYSREHIETTLLNLWYNHEKYQSGTYFYVTVRLVRTIGNNMYLEDAEEQDIELDNGEIVSGKGAFYAFSGYSVAYYRYYKIGEVFKMRCQLEWDSDYGTQLTGVSKTSNPIKEQYALPEIPVLDANDLGYSLQEVKDEQGNYIETMASDLGNYFCKVVTVENLKCQSVKLKGSGEDQYYTATMTNDAGTQFDVFFNKSLITTWNVTEMLQVGKYYSITGGVAYYQYANGYFQLSVGDAPRYANGELYAEDEVRINDIVEMTK